MMRLSSLHRKTYNWGLKTDVFFKTCGQEKDKKMMLERRLKVFWVK